MFVEDMAPAAGSPEMKPGEVVNTSVPSSEVRGDWVLFHPVYSREELHSVEVSSTNNFQLHVIRDCS